MEWASFAYETGLFHSIAEVSPSGYSMRVELTSAARRPERKAADLPSSATHDKHTAQQRGLNIGN
uniref:Uncharacterized protein n=1 Tax=Timema tahoe TaxID=61484 RepID=A0A7R9IH27_9NEOP|nr:unnamed protein product [Timema tahoe]